MNDTRSEPPDEELLQHMRRKQEDFPAAREAWGVFYVRHVQFLYRCIANADRVLVGFGIGAEDIVEETFTKVWESGADSFSVPQELDPEEATLCCKGWLAKIARNLIRDKLRSRKPDLVDPDENEELFTAPETAVEQFLGIHQLVTRTLSERDAAIVWFKIGYYNPDTGKSQPPRDVHDAFCKERGITPDVLRKAYDRALKLLGEAYTTTPR
jgi:DNA-directed RNA polymerase specialized sigma24 family protein